MTSLSSVAVDKTIISYEMIYGSAPVEKKSVGVEKLSFLGDAVPAALHASMVGCIVLTDDQRFEEFVMPARVGNSGSPAISGGAGVLIGQSNPTANALNHSFEAGTGVTHGGTFTASSTTTAKDLRSLLPNAPLGEVNRLLGALDGFVETCVSYGPLFARLFALAEGVAHGWTLANLPVGGGRDMFWDHANVANQVTWVNRIVNSIGDQNSPLCGFRHRPTRPLTEGIVNALYYVTQAHCGFNQRLRAGGYPGVAGRMTDGLSLYIYANQVPPPNVNNGCTLDDVRNAIRYVLTCTGDVAGLSSGYEIWARRVEFAGPELTLLPTPLGQRFFRTETATFCRAWLAIFRVLFLLSEKEANPANWGAAGTRILVNDAEITAALVPVANALAAIAPAITANDVGESDNWRAIWNAAWLNANDNKQLFVYGVGGYRDIIGAEYYIRTDIWLQLGRAVPAGDLDWNTIFNLPAHTHCTTPADRMPVRNLLHTDTNMPADGLYGRHVMPVCSGITGLKGETGYTHFTDKGSCEATKILSVANGNELLCRMYFGSIVLRCATNQASHLHGSSQFAGAMSMGIINTGNAQFDEVYSAYVSQGAVVDHTTLTTAHFDAVKSILNWEATTQAAEINTYTHSIWNPHTRNEYVKEVCFHPFIDTLVLGTSSVVGGVINAQPATLSDKLAGCRGSLATIGLDENLTRADAVGLSAWMLGLAGTTVEWSREMEYRDEDTRSNYSSAWAVGRFMVRDTDGMYGLPRIDSLYHWYYSDGLDANWRCNHEAEGAVTVQRYIYNVSGFYLSLYNDTSDTAIRQSLGSGTLILHPARAARPYRGVMIGGGGEVAYRTCMPLRNPPPQQFILPGVVVSDALVLSALPGKYLNLKNQCTALLTGVKVRTAPNNTLSAMARNWVGFGNLGAKMKMLGVLLPSGKPSEDKPGQPDDTITVATQPSTVSTITKDSQS
jgi:hypothetical protein